MPKFIESVALIEKESDKHFDPQVVEAFKKALPEILEIKEKFSDRLEDSGVLT